jgi:type I restriction enzyme S subunit
MIEYKTIEEISLPKGIRYGVVQPGQNLSDGVPMLNSGDLSNGIVKSQPNFYIAKAISDKHKKSILKGGELLITLVGTPGITAIAPDSLVGCNVSRAIGVVDLISEISANYVMYALQTPLAQHQIKVRLNTTVQPTFNLSELKNIKIPLPELSKQISIAQVLSAIDEKIEINRKMNQTLEDIAKAIFKSWFLDFDPVRAKIEGRPTGLPPEIDELFPDALVDSEIGEIPKGWQISTFADVLEIQGGFAFKSKDFGEDGDPVIKIKNIRGDGTVDQFDCDRVANADKKLDKFLLRDGDAVIAMTGATVGKVGLMSVNDEKYYLNQRVGRLLPKSSSDRCWYSVLLLSSQKTKDFIEGYAYGSAQPNISSKDIGSIPNMTPCSELVESFNQTVSPLFLRTLITLKEIEILAELRDTLLPKLFSGELRIPDAEKFLEEAGI